MAGAPLVASAGQYPGDVGSEVEASVHRVAGAGYVGLEFQFRVCLAVVAQIMRSVGEFVTYDEGPGIGWNRGGRPGIDLNLPGMNWTTDPRQRAFLGNNNGPGNSLACGFGYHAGDPVDFPKS